MGACSPRAAAASAQPHCPPPSRSPFPTHMWGTEVFEQPRFPHLPLDHDVSHSWKKAASHPGVRSPIRALRQEAKQSPKPLGCPPGADNRDIHSAGWMGDKRQEMPVLTQLWERHFYSGPGEAFEKPQRGSGTKLPLAINRMSPQRAHMKCHLWLCYQLHWDITGKACCAPAVHRVPSSAVRPVLTALLQEPVAVSSQSPVKENSMRMPEYVICSDQTMYN